MNFHVALLQGDTVLYETAITRENARRIQDHLHPTGLWWLNGKTGANTIPALKRTADANQESGADALLDWAVKHLDGIWEIDR